jgi:hypothetical protein
MGRAAIAYVASPWGRRLGRQCGQQQQPILVAEESGLAVSLGVGGHIAGLLSLRSGPGRAFCPVDDEAANTPPTRISQVNLWLELPGQQRPDVLSSP